MLPKGITGKHLNIALNSLRKPGIPKVSLGGMPPDHLEIPGCAFSE